MKIKPTHIAVNTKSRIRSHEGKRYRPYRDSKGLLTVGIGRCIDRVPFSDDEIALMFQNDYMRAVGAAMTLPVYDQLNEARQGVLTEMCFQMGLAGVKGFAKFIAAAQRGDWQGAHDEMLDSKWAREDTPERAERLARIFLTGEFD